MIAQGTDEWRQRRLGKVTASRIADVLRSTKTGYSASRANYMADLMTERLTGEPVSKWTSKEMEWGAETEPQARAAYSFQSGNTVVLAEFTDHPVIDNSGASPDGLIGDDGLVEIKCPNTATHIDSLLGGAVPKQYVDQMLWQMACTGRLWCDFVSFDPRLPPHLQLFIRRLARDQARIDAMTAEVEKFTAEMADKLAALDKAYPAA